MNSVFLSRTNQSMCNCKQSKADRRAQSQKGGKRHFFLSWLVVFSEQHIKSFVKPYLLALDLLDQHERDLLQAYSTWFSTWSSYLFPLNPSPSDATSSHGFPPYDITLILFIPLLNVYFPLSLNSHFLMTLSKSVWNFSLHILYRKPYLVSNCLQHNIRQI